MNCGTYVSLRVVILIALNAELHETSAALSKEKVYLGFSYKVLIKLQ